MNILAGRTAQYRMTLREQMQITERELKQRKDMFDLTPDDEQALHAMQPRIKENLEALIDHFYAEQTAFEDIALLIGDADTLAKLRASMRGYIIDLFSGSYDMEYVNSRLRIGLVHKRIGVSPKLYLSGVRTLQKLISDVLRAKGDDDGEACLRALRKLVLFDISYVMDTYIRSLMSEVDKSHAELEKYAAGLEQEVDTRTRELKQEAQIDTLTKLYNQRSFYDHLRRALAMAKRYGEPLSLVYMDMDGFKEINDSEGHTTGDEVLSAFGQAVRESIREMDIGCRYGGDEFCIILPHADAEHAVGVSERIAMEMAILWPTINFSTGIATTGPREFVDGDTLVNSADKAMYKAKGQGPGIVEAVNLNTAPRAEAPPAPEEGGPAAEEENPVSEKAIG